MTKSSKRFRQHSAPQSKMAISSVEAQIEARLRALEISDTERQRAARADKIGRRG